MEGMILLGYLSAVVIGVSLGLIGGGGSILTVPALVYLMHINPVLATAYSLFIVGATSLAGSVSFMRRGLVNYKTAIIFAAPSFIAVFLTRHFLVPAIPETIFTTGNFVLTKNTGIMIFFALTMFAAAISMIRDNNIVKNSEGKLQFRYPLIAVDGVLIGVVTGIVGAGGGFLIIPALVLLARLPMKMAVGTSLLIIAIKSLIGFLGDIDNQPIDWYFMLIFTSISLLGVFLGSWLSTKTEGEHLKKGFGWFVLVMAAYIFVRELYYRVE